MKKILILSGFLLYGIGLSAMKPAPAQLDALEVAEKEIYEKFAGTMNGIRWNNTVYGMVGQSTLPVLNFYQAYQKACDEADKIPKLLAKAGAQFDKAKVPDFKQRVKANLRWQLDFTLKTPKSHYGTPKVPHTEMQEQATTNRAKKKEQNSSSVKPEHVVIGLGSLLLTYFLYDKYCKSTERRFQEHNIPQV